MLSPRRVSLFCGHYGSGKTNLAVNYAIELAKQGHQVQIADMDIVNPYFRTKDSARELEEAGVQMVASQFANSGAELPAMPSEFYGLFEFHDKLAILDVGGDDRGAYALGRYAPMILEENDYHCFFVANFYRPLTRTPKEALGVMREIELAGKVPFTAIINNANLGEETTVEDIERTFPLIEELSRISGLPVAFTGAKKELASRLSQADVLPLTLQAKYY